MENNMNKISGWMEGYKEGYNDAMAVVAELLDKVIKTTKMLSRDARGLMNLSEYQKGIDKNNNL